MITIKKIILFIFTLLIYQNIYAININSNKIVVSLNKCVDGDTAIFNYQGEAIKVRFLAIDSPELEHEEQKEEPYAMDARNYTCSKLKNAKKIHLEFDDNADKQDKYDRYLAWIFVDDELLQEKIIENGYAEVAYLYNDYKYTNILKNKQKKAQKNKKGIWSDYKDNNNYILIIPIILLALLIILLSRKK